MNTASLYTHLILHRRSITEAEARIRREVSAPRQPQMCNGRAEASTSRRGSHHRRFNSAAGLRLPSLLHRADIMTSD